MNELIMQIGSTLIGAGLMLALMGLGVAVIMPGIDRTNRRFFMAFFTILVLYAGLALVEEIIYLHDTMKPALKIIYYFETLSASALMLLMTFYLLYCCGESWQHSLHLRIAAGLWVAFFIILNMNLTPLITLFYYVTPENQFHRGSLYSLITIPLAAIQILNLTGVFRWRSRLSPKNYYAFLVGLLPVTLAMFVHIFVSVFELFAFGMVICALSMFGLILADQIEQYMHQQREIAHQRSSIMVLQMRPHFIYNTMMSIYYLCKQDPDLAQKVTLNFTTYLRKNFTAITSEEPIPFSEELEHTRAYLAVEKAQFDDSLFIDFDTPYIDFYLPPLTLQPIVENAVKHGMDPDSEPLHIFIQTKRTESGSEIIVENNGADYEPADDSEPHIALKNIQQRLEMMCHGKMMITPRKGGGTVVKVLMP